MNNQMRDWIVELYVFLQKTGSLGKTHPRVGHQRDQPTKIVVELAALRLNGADGIERQRNTPFHTSVSIIVDLAERVGELDAHFAGCEVDHRPNRAEHAGDAAARQAAFDQIVAESIGIRLGVGRDVLVTTDINDVATGPLRSPMEGDRASLPLELEVDSNGLGEPDADGLSSRDRNPCRNRVTVLGHPEKVLSRKVTVTNA